MKWTVIIAVLIVLVIVISYSLKKRPELSQRAYWSSRYIESPLKIYGRSIGGFDDAANLAVNRALDARVPDHGLVATIIARNVHNLPDDDRAGLARVARRNYMEALHPNNPGGEFPHEFVIDAALVFAMENMMDLFAGDHQLADAAMIKQDEVIKNRVRESEVISENNGGAKGAGIESYVNMATQHTDDPQNSHDTGVIACMRSILDRLRSDQEGNPLLSREAIISDIKRNGSTLSDGRNHRVVDVLKVVDETAKGEMMFSLGATDDECLVRLWTRVYDLKNLHNRQALKQALFDALYDSWEEGIDGTRKIVCVNGRTSRLMSALALLDWDERNWEVKKLEQFKNDIFEKAFLLIQSESLKAIEPNNSEGRKKAGMMYLAKTKKEVDAIGHVDEEEMSLLENDIKKAVTDMIHKYVDEVQPSGVIPQYMVDSITKEALAAIG